MLVRQYQTACARTAGHWILEREAVLFCRIPWKWGRFLGIFCNVHKKEGEIGKYVYGVLYCKIGCKML